MASVRKAQILVVDDEPGMLETMADILLAEGYVPKVASRVALARVLLQAGGVDAVLTDLILPDGNGLDLARWAASRVPGTPFFFTSAYTDLALANHLLKVGRPFFPKPIDMPQLLEVLAAACRPTLERTAQI